MHNSDPLDCCSHTSSESAHSLWFYLDRSVPQLIKARSLSGGEEDYYHNRVHPNKEFIGIWVWGVSWILEWTSEKRENNHFERRFWDDSKVFVLLFKVIFGLLSIMFLLYYHSMFYDNQVRLNSFWLLNTLSFLFEMKSYWALRHYNNVGYLI